VDHRSVAVIMRPIILALLTALLLAAPASGATYSQPPTDRPLTGKRITDSLRIATVFWGQSLPCDVHVYAATAAELAASLPAQSNLVTIAATPAYDGRAPTGECPIWLGPTIQASTWQNRYEVCLLLQHEIGHDLGYRSAPGQEYVREDGTLDAYHSRDPNSIMTASTLPPTYGCMRRWVPRGQGREFRETYGTAWATRPDWAPVTP
jgi:hypothetical protein